MLWQGWLEKHPETVTPPWDDVDTRAAWDEHAAEAYYRYWEQYTYWAAQGWTASNKPCGGEEGQEEGVTGEAEASRNDPGDHGRAEALHHETSDCEVQPDATSGNDNCGGEEREERGSRLLELMKEMSLHTTEGEAGGSGVAREQRGGDHEEPCDTGNDHKRAASSRTAAGNTGKGLRLLKTNQTFHHPVVFCSYNV